MAITLQNRKNVIAQHAVQKLFYLSIARNSQKINSKLYFIIDKQNKIYYIIKKQFKFVFERRNCYGAEKHTLLYDLRQASNYT